MGMINSTPKVSEIKIISGNNSQAVGKTTSNTPAKMAMPNSDKYYARSRILERADDEEWLSRATAALGQHWQDKNARKTGKQNGHARPVGK